MSEDEIFDSGFHQWWPMIKRELDREAVSIQSNIDAFFDQVRYAGIGDERPAIPPLAIDLTGPAERIPYTLTLNPGRTAESLVDQIRYERTKLFTFIQRLSATIRLTAGASRVEWVRPIEVHLVMPPTTEELIRFSGLAQGTFWGDAIKDPVVWIGGRIIAGPVVKS